MASSAAPQGSFREKLKPYVVPYYISIAAFLGAITAVFTVVIALLIIVVLNFNVLGWIE